MANVSTLIHTQDFLQRSLLFGKRPKQLFSSVLPAVAEECFFSPYIIVFHMTVCWGYF